MEAILNNSSYHLALAKIESFIEKGFDQLSAGETAELEMLSSSVERYESQKYPMPLQSSIAGMLLDVMQDQRIKRSELSKLLEIPNSTLSDILNGKKKINISIARKLHEKLHFDGNTILESA
jgi:HTH-type transcriptional regulator/antitoxin HigA